MRKKSQGTLWGRSGFAHGMRALEASSVAMGVFVCGTGEMVWARSKPPGVAMGMGVVGFEGREMCSPMVGSLVVAR
jgi:hypothetical protein